MTHNRLVAGPTPAGPTDKKKTPGHQEFFVFQKGGSTLRTLYFVTISSRPNGICGRSLPFHFDAVHLDLRAIVVRRVTK